MEKLTVTALLEKYWRTETSVEEEKALADWFNAQPPGSLDPDLEPYAALFTWFDEEAQIHPSPDFETRILDAITPVRHFRWGLISAAATVLIVVTSLYLLTPNPERPTNTKPIAQIPANPIQIKDTYDDPEKALASVRHALLIASAHLNEGRKQITNK